MQPVCSLGQQAAANSHFIDVHLGFLGFKSFYEVQLHFKILLILQKHTVFVKLLFLSMGSIQNCDPKTLTNKY